VEGLQVLDTAVDGLFCESIAVELD
jgi:hypothetical protein